jgi:hypothetical protein
MDASKLLRARALALAVLVVPAMSTAAAAKPITVSVLSTRADLVSGGDALVRIGGVKSTKGLRVTVRGKNRSKAFAKRSNGTVTGLITRLKLGRSAIVATAGKRSAKLVVTNHPKGGPLFSGPQLQPWKCQDTAKDAQCNEPAKFAYIYKSTDGSAGFKDYDPKNPPTDVANTTTDSGVTVPFVVRVESGFIDRDRYQIATLFRPGQKWSAARPQKQFNHKLLITHGAGCGADHQTAGAPSVTDSSQLGSGTSAAEVGLGRGFALMSSALDNAGHNCNVVSEAEALLMTKEHLIERYGTLRYTIGTGCSGGSLAEQWIANAYPGIYQGILPTCSFPDAWGTSTQFLDYHQTLRYFMDPSLWGAGVAWTPQQMADVQGHISIANSQVSDNAQWHVVIPTDPCAGVTAQERYDPNTNPGGVRCTIQDAAINVLGPRPESVWTAQEKQVGKGWAGVPTDNVGVQYGLKALQAAKITPAQFVDLNQKIGGISLVNAEYTPERLKADQPTLGNAYRTGMINEANNLDRTAIIDCRGPDPGAFHDAYRAFAMRARLDRAHGNHANQLIWEGPVLIIGDSQCEVNSFGTMDKWLTAVEKDKAKGSVAQKVARDKPADATDRCYDGNGAKVSDAICGEPVVPIYGTPRTVAGDALTTDTNKCQLKPLNRSDNYGPIPLTDDQWSALQQLFPDGVCDFSKPGVDQQGTVTWLTYQNAKGKVVYGGRPMGAAPRSHRVKARHSP